MGPTLGDGSTALVRGCLDCISWSYMGGVLQGSATTVFAATAPGLEAHSGAYLQDCAVSAPNKQGQDPELARKLWASTEDQIQAALAAS